MKNLKNIFVIIFMITPLFTFAQVDEDASAGKLKLEGSIGSDEGGVYLISENCQYSGKYYFAPILPTDTDDKKTNKKNAKSNKKTQKKIDKYASKLNGEITGMTVTCLMNKEKRQISFGNIVAPITEPIEIATTPAANDLNKTIYQIALRVNIMKNLSKTISFAGEEVNGVESVMYYYVNPNCKKIAGLPQGAEGERIISNLAKAAEMGAGLLTDLIGIKGKVEAATEEVKKLKPPHNIAAGAANAQAISNVAKLTNEVEGLIKNIQDLNKSIKKQEQL